MGKMKLFETESRKGKTHPITLEAVGEAYRKVHSNGGSAGVDNQTVEEFESDKVSLLYKLWNRMSSGSYFPKMVLGKEIPKLTGGTRVLGIPTVTDRIAQQVVLNAMQPKMEEKFYADSYGYRPGRGAHDALRKCMDRCREYNWIIDIDIKGFFDNINHYHMMKIVQIYFKERWIQMYVLRWLKSPMQMPDGSVKKRWKGTPQGGVISPLLANMFLHVVFDWWIEELVCKKQGVDCKWERYADDIVVHCRSKQEARAILRQLKIRMKRYALDLHPEKTKIVYCKSTGNRAKYDTVQFTFLGYEFSPAQAKCRDGRTRTIFRAKISRPAIKNINQTFMRMKIHRQTSKTLVELAIGLRSQLRGWIRYYSLFNSWALRDVFEVLNKRLVRWYTNKYKLYRRRTWRARQQLRQVARDYPTLFVHWEYGYTP